MTSPDIALVGWYSSVAATEYAGVNSEVKHVAVEVKDGYERIHPFLTLDRVACTLPKSNEIADPLELKNFLVE